jgi:carbamoyl-phosphate synthase large subunit
MKSTGEVKGVDADSGIALAKAMVAAGHALPTGGTVFVSVANRDKRAIVFPAKRLADLGFRLVATGGTAGVLQRAGIAVERVAKMSEGPDNVGEMIRGGRVDLVVNTPFGRGPRTDGYFIRTAAASAGVPCVTTLPGVFAAVRGIEALLGASTEPRSIQEYHAEAMAEPMQGRLTFEQAASTTAAGEPPA